MPGTRLSPSTTTLRRWSNASTILPTSFRGPVSAARQIDRELARIVVKLARPYRIAEPPAGHGVGLRPAVEQNEAITDRRVAEQTDMHLAIIEHVVVNLVRHDGDVGKALETSHKLVDFGFWRHAAGRIGGRVDDQEPR